MALYDVELEDGSIYEVETEEESPAQTPLQRTEAGIAERRSLIPAAAASGRETALSLLPNPRRNVMDFLNPLGAIDRTVKDVGLQAVAGQEMLESAQANPALALQRGKPGDIFADLIKGFKGERVAERGDVMRAVGAPEPVAATVGVLSSPETALPAMMGLTKGFRAGKAGVNATTQTFSAGSPKQAPVIAGRIRDAFAKTKLAAGDEFGKQLDDLSTKFPERRVSLRSMVDRLNEVRAESPKLASDLAGGVRKSGNRLLKDLLDNPELADDLTVVQAQEVKKTLQKVPSLAIKSGKFGAQFSDTDLDLIEAVNDTRSAMLESFPEMEDVFSKYGETLNKFKLLKNKFKVGSLLGNIEKSFGDKEVMQLVEELLPPQALQDMRLLQRSVKARGLAQATALGGAGTLGAAWLLKLLLGKSQ